jgi:hypothetical protein
MSQVIVALGWPVQLRDKCQGSYAGKQVPTAPDSPSLGVTVAMIVDNGCPIELVHFAKD